MRYRTSKEKEELSRLFRAACADDTAAARKILNDSFWQNTSCQPEPLHLCMAALHNNHSMINLLACHGAALSMDDVHALAQLCPQGWEDHAASLRAAGVKVPQQTKKDPVKTAHLAGEILRALDEAKAECPETLHQHLRQCMTEGIVALVTQHRAEEAARLLLRSGNSTKIDISSEVQVLLEGNQKNIAALQSFESAFKWFHQIECRAENVEISPRARDNLIKHPTVFRMLRASGALKKEILFFECWLKALADDPDGKWRAQYAAEARGMFPHHVRGRPGRELIQDYLDFHEKAAKTAPDSLKKIDAILCETFFFKGDVSPDTDCWTGAELDKLSRHYDRTYAGGLCRDFNLLAATKTFEPGDAFRKKLSPDFIKTFRLAQERGLYKASDLQIKYILDYFFEDKGIKKGNVTKEVIDFLSSMRKGNSNLHDFDPNKYLGTEAPGLAKVLLEMDFVMAGQFQLKPILDHARAQKGVLGFGKKERNPAYAEFLAQLILEETHYHQALPMRQIEKKSYCHELFRLVGRHRLSGYIDEKHFDVFGGDFCSVPTSRRMGRK